MPKKLSDFRIHQNARRSRPEISDEECIEIARRTLCTRDALIYELRYFGDGAVPCMTVRQVSARIGVDASTVFRAFVRIRPLMDAAEEAFIGARVLCEGAVPDCYRREDFSVVTAHGHRAASSPDMTPSAAIGRDIALIRARERDRTEEFAAEAWRKEDGWEVKKSAACK